MKRSIFTTLHYSELNDNEKINKNCDTFDETISIFVYGQAAGAAIIHWNSFVVTRTGAKFVLP